MAHHHQEKPSQQKDYPYANDRLRPVKVDKHIDQGCDQDDHSQIKHGTACY